MTGLSSVCEGRWVDGSYENLLHMLSPEWLVGWYETNSKKETSTDTNNHVH